MFRFYFALWVSKLVAFIYKLKGDEKNDRPGRLAFKLCPNFLSHIGKPRLIIAITGTNGKTTTSALINDMLNRHGYSTSFNDWGANLHAGYCLNLMRANSIFNKPKVYASVLEADEMTLPYTMSMIRPNYILVTNICKDSLRRNGHPEYIFDCIEETFQELGSETTAILNANDPISSQLALTTGANRIFYGMSDVGLKPFENISKDISVCPYCGSNIEYDFRLYRHIGGFKCPNCDFRVPNMEFKAESVDLENGFMTVTEKNGTTDYPLISETIFNAFNVLAAITFFRLLAISPKDIADFLRSQKVTEIRESCVEYNGIKYYTYGAKSQNVSAASTVFEYMAKEPSIKDVVLCMDEVQDRNHPTETLTWLYETDYEALNSPNISRIICAGHMFLNHRLRMLLAGIPEEKIFCIEDDDRVPDFVETEGIESVYVLFETDYVTKARNWRDAIVKRAKSKEVKGI